MYRLRSAYDTVVQENQGLPFRLRERTALNSLYGSLRLRFSK